MESTFLRSAADSNRTVQTVVFETCKTIDTPRSLAVWLMYSNAEHKQLVQLDIDPLSYCDADSFADDYLVTKFLSKYPGLQTGIDTRAAALDTFLSCERKCAETNTRLSRDPFGALGPIMDSMRKIISSVLPVSDEHPTLPIDDIVSRGGWGPGVTSSVKGTDTSRFNKLSGRVDLTKNLYDVGGLAILASSPAWQAFHSCQSAPGVTYPVNYHLVGGNTLTFVPKNAKTDRPIAVEPHLNAYLQKGIGSYIRDRLLRVVGLDLTSQEINSDLARLGSQHGNVATIDLKSASDTISQEVVEFLLPPEWVHLLGSCRSQKYLMNEKWHHYHKWSSMGNGYTFELETLVFYSAAMACTHAVGGDPSLVRVYGDDVAIPTAAVSLFYDTVEHLGFSINKEKSYHEGPFRESCGKDYFNGVDVRPFFIREPLTHVSNVFKLANAVQRYALKRLAFGRDARFKNVWLQLFLSVKKIHRFRIPDGIGDGGFIGSFDECTPTRSRRKSILYQRSWYKYPNLVFKPVSKTKDGSLAVISVLKQDENVPHEIVRGVMITNVIVDDILRLASSSPLDGSIYQLRKKGRYELATGFTPVWPDLGPWVSRDISN